MLTCIVIALTPNCSLTAQHLNKTEIVDLFSEGKTLFHQAMKLSSTKPKTARKLYQDDLLRFERIIREGGVENGKLCYNIGNIYFRIGDISRAIFYYRKAQLYIPDDENLIHNLTYARNQRVDQIEEKETSKVLKTIFFWHYDFSSKTRLILFAVFFGLLWVFASIRLFIKNPMWIWCIVLSTCLATLPMGSLIIDEAVSSRHLDGVIFASEVIARKGDSKTYQPSFKKPLHAGTEFRLLEERNTWYYIELADGRCSWIPSKSVGLIY